MKFNLTSARDLTDLAKKLAHGLVRLRFEDNMESQKEVGLTITASGTLTIGNKLTFIPSQYIITSQEGNGLITKTGVWTNKFLYLKNNGAEDVTITVIFMR
jgi:hypothetical protein